MVIIIVKKLPYIPPFVHCGRFFTSSMTVYPTRGNGVRENAVLF